jgi:hypothetical protein
MTLIKVRLIAQNSENRFISDIERSNIPLYAIGSGSATAITCTLSPAPSSWATIGIMLVKVPITNTGALTVNPNGLGARTIKKQYNVDLAAGDVPAGMIMELWNDGVTLQLLNPVANASGGKHSTYRYFDSTFQTQSTSFVSVPYSTLNLQAGKKYQIFVRIRVSCQDASYLAVVRLVRSGGYCKINGILSMVSILDSRLQMVLSVKNYEGQYLSAISPPYTYPAYGPIEGILTADVYGSSDAQLSFELFSSASDYWAYLESGSLFYAVEL